jgi:hypothetical protein
MIYLGNDSFTGSLALAAMPLKKANWAKFQKPAEKSYIATLKESQTLFQFTAPASMPFQ